MNKLRLIKNNCIIHEDIKLVLFDKDGTLTDVHYYWVKMINLRSQLIYGTFFINKKNKNEIINHVSAAMGVDIAKNRLKPEGPVGVKSREHIIKTALDAANELLSKKISLVEMSEVFKKIDEQTAKNILPLLSILPGVKAFLAKCKKYKIKLAIVTTDITPRAKISMNALGLSELFDQILGGDLVRNKKPAPDIAKMAMEKCQIAPENTAVIGDHPVDINMGLNSNIKCNIGVLTGLASEEDLKKHNCYIIETFNDLAVKNA
ncbi:HAD family hydrolase [Sulfobacillus acidophilus]|uniref:HAD family hydrolase n=1 Tax=Sulfobacillus acidophilus TaxID=53633 RepID=A0ABS3AX89_9FIRM|nr:HAD family hydrolase [Sulfobacillus acidophilus]